MMEYTEEYRSVVRKIKARQNGPTADLLEKMGIIYPLILGLSISQIKELAKPFKNNNSFAWLLWSKDIRETKLMALMIFDHTNLTTVETDSIVLNFSNSEQVEQAVIHIFSKQTNALENAVKYCQKNKEFVKMTGYNLLARLSMSDNNISKTDVLKFFQFIKKDLVTNSSHIMRSISFALRKLGNINNEFKQLALQLCDEIEETGNRSALWIATDTRIELEVTL